MHFSSGILPLMSTISLLTHQSSCSPLKDARQLDLPIVDIDRYEIQAPPLSTRWTHDIAPEQRWPSYPRPQLRRSDWQSLNGIWRWLHPVRPMQSGMIPSAIAFNTEVLVPSCLESGLSGIMKDGLDDSWYYREFTVPEDWSGKQIMLNFGAIDYEATAYVNGEQVGEHKGGYDSFSFDITANLKTNETNELTVHVLDPTDTAGNIPLGKQASQTVHIFYTPCTGIWQSVWIEPVVETHVTQIDLHGSTKGHVTVTVHTNGGVESGAKVTLHKAGEYIGGAIGRTNEPFSFGVGVVSLWSPQEPQLYDVEVEFGNDTVKSYMGFRTIEKHWVQDKPRPVLNGEFEFQMGVLDQGYWPDGIYTAPSETAMEYDIRTVKSAGFNMMRKHIKVEPAIFYYACDRLGIMVIQDMPSLPALPEAINRIPNADEYIEFGRQLEIMVKQHISHPSIITWTIFNEGWGQGHANSTPEATLVERVRALDPTRLIDAVSGWYDHGYGDFVSVHNYPEPRCGVKDVPGLSPDWDGTRIGFQSEYGGLGTRPDPQNLWPKERAKATIDETYTVEKDTAEWNAQAHRVLEVLKNQTRNFACSGAVWTQTTDVEGEVNGLMTYDRDVVRMDMDQWRRDIDEVYIAAADSLANGRNQDVPDIIEELLKGGRRGGGGD